MTALAYSTSLQPALPSLHRSERILTTFLHRIPAEEQRIFLFIDLNDSTMLAEILGHLKYSVFLSTFFADFQSSLTESDGDVYQYVGDEVRDLGILKNKSGSCRSVDQAIEYYPSEQSRKIYFPVWVCSRV
jgi:adenylate cyclase